MWEAIKNDSSKGKVAYFKKERVWMFAAVWMDTLKDKKHLESLYCKIIVRK